MGKLRSQDAAWNAVYYLALHTQQAFPTVHVTTSLFLLFVQSASPNRRVLFKDNLFLSRELRGLPRMKIVTSCTPFTEGRLGVNNKASPPGRHQEQAP